jgi:hypothetical protein
VTEYITYVVVDMLMQLFRLKNDGSMFIMNDTHFCAFLWQHDVLFERVLLVFVFVAFMNISILLFTFYF